MRTQSTVSGIVLIIAFGLVLTLACKTNTQRTREAANAITISAEDLYRAYQSNEAEADKLYQARTLIVTGTVGTTSTPERGMGNPAVILVDARQKPNVNCFGFSPDAKDAITKLKTGQSVSVKGKCMGKVATDEPSLEDSVLQ
ncbi:MAG TPA: hypothetical protein VKJ45_18525 [Blastocatellia bacterium]|nr:hypothetical protein [Blastocatellia bacterium]